MRGLRSRPAETAGATFGTGGLVAGIAAHNWLAVGVAVVGYVPAVVTFIAVHGGLHGIARLIWVGSQTHE